MQKQDERFPKAALIHVKLQRRPWWGFTHWRLGNASQFFFLWFQVTVRRSWLPQTAYMEGWNACWRELYYAGKIVPFEGPPEFRFGKPPEDDEETTLRFTKFVSGQTDEL